jgi:peptide/nickel transport system permease protein
VRTWEGALGLLLLFSGAAVALLAPLLVPGDPLDIAGRPLTQPLANPALPLGTDRLGRNILAGLLYGARSTLATAGAVALMALALGAAVGTLAGYVGGIVDEALMRVADAIQTVPAFVLALALVSVLGPSQTTVVLALAAGAWTAPARVVRAQVLSLKSRAFVEASRLFGRSPVAVAFDVVLPECPRSPHRTRGRDRRQCDPPRSGARVSGARRPECRELGRHDRGRRSVLRTAPHVIVAPGLAVMVTGAGGEPFRRGAVAGARSERIRVKD